MTTLLLVSSLLLALSLGLITKALIQLRRNAVLTHRLRAGIAMARHPRAAAAFALNEQKSRTRILQSTVESGTSALEMAHQTIASTTFGLIDRFSTSASVRDRARHAQQVHDRSSRQVYRSLKGANRTLHALAGVIMNQRAERSVRDASRPAPTEKRPARDEDTSTGR